MRGAVRVLVTATAAMAVLGSATGIAAAAPASGITADLVGTPSTQVSFQCGLRVTNRGPAVAHNVRVLQPPFTSYNLGDLPVLTKPRSDLPRSPIGQRVRCSRD